MDRFGWCHPPESLAQGALSWPRKIKGWVAGGNLPSTRPRTLILLTTDRSLVVTRSAPGAFESLVSLQTGQWTPNQRKKTQSCHHLRQIALRMTLWTLLQRPRKWQCPPWKLDVLNERWRLHPPMVVGAWVAPPKSCGIHWPSAWVPYRCPPSDWLGFGPSEGTIHFWIETLNSPANRPGLHKLAPRSQTKEGFCCCGVLSCVCVCVCVCVFFRRAFLVTCWHFLIAWKLAG